MFGDVGLVILVEPLMKSFEVTGDTDALAFCTEVVNWVMAPETGFVDEGYRFSGWLRGLAAATSLTTRFGGTTDTEPCCTCMELTTSALALATVRHTQ